MAGLSYKGIINESEPSVPSVVKTADVKPKSVLSTKSTEKAASKKDIASGKAPVQIIKPASSTKTEKPETSPQPTVRIQPPKEDKKPAKETLQPSPVAPDQSPKDKTSFLSKLDPRRYLKRGCSFESNKKKCESSAVVALILQRHRRKWTN